MHVYFNEPEPTIVTWNKMVKGDLCFLNDMARAWSLFSFTGSIQKYDKTGKVRVEEYLLKVFSQFRSISTAYPDFACPSVPYISVLVTYGAKQEKDWAQKKNVKSKNNRAMFFLERKGKKWMVPL
jgi:hypothetical protein